MLMGFLMLFAHSRWSQQIASTVDLSRYSNSWSQQIISTDNLNRWSQQLISTENHNR
jgi:hypothetical protein